MKWLTPILLFVILGLVTHEACAKEVPLIEQREATVTVVARWQVGNNFIQSMGSGVYVSKDKLVTCFHVAFGDPKPTIIVIDANGKQRDGELIAWDIMHDIAMIKTNRRKGPVANLAKDIPELGSPIRAFGSPDGIPQTLTSGIVSHDQEEIFENMPEVFLTDAIILPGSSGCGVWDDNGDLIGIALAIHGNKKAPGGLSIILPIDAVRKFVEKEPKVSERPEVRTLEEFLQRRDAEQDEDDFLPEKGASFDKPVPKRLLE